MNNLVLPKVLSIKYNIDGNKILQYLDDEKSLPDCELLSKEPFVVSADQQQYLITNKRDVIMDDHSHILLSSRKPTKKDFESNSLNLTEWLKHPKLINVNVEEVSQSWVGNFNFIKEQEEFGISGLRAPQLGALHSILAHQHNADDVGIVVMPTGTGKTETMICAMVVTPCKKLLVTVPSDSLRTQLSWKFLTLGLLKKFGIVGAAALNPIVGILNSRITTAQELDEFLSKVNVVITTMSILTGATEEQKVIMSEKFSHLFVDEAHHSEASTWKNFITHFNKEKVFLFTATPYRNDGKKLVGKFIFNFSLKKAQQQHYYKEIKFLPIREYDKSKADKMIADRAVSKLREDRENGYAHIILARCMSKHRANEVFKFYEQHEDLNPVVVYTGKSGLKDILQEIKEKKHSIIVCVDMLGEGFDLPELKIGAIHDERQSIPITLQFIGRFTRTSYDELGEASFITNMAYPPIKEELDQLYSKDADWNLLLPILSEGAAQKEINFRAFLEGFNHLENSIIPFQNIVPALSTVIYKNGGDEWNPNNWQEGVTNLNTYDHQYYDHNPEKNTLVIILGKVTRVEWGSFDAVQDLSWDMIVVHWDLRPEINRVFINTSIKGLSTDPLVKAIFGDDAFKVTGMNVFRIFHEVHRLSLFNVGARKGLGKDISFQSFYGKGVQDGLRMLEQGTLIKNNIFGVGYKEGNKVSLGCSVKGKIWSYLRGNLEELIVWCRTMGEIVMNTAINPNTVLEHTLEIEIINSRPNVTAIAVDWHPRMYEFSESRYELYLDGIRFFIWEIELELIENSAPANLTFALNTEQKRVVFELVLDEITVNGESVSRFKINKLGNLTASISYGSKNENLEDYFQNHTPLFWFADGSQLMQNQYVKPREKADVISLDQIFSQTWPGVSIHKESQGISPYVQDSIQFNFINQIKDDYELIYDDDGSGEIADIIGINDSANHIDIHLYHLKYARNGQIGNNIENFYQVCGQAQKSLNWKYRPGKEFFDHLFKRKTKRRNENECSRLIKGSEEQLESLLNAAKWTKELRFYINIVQPGLLKTAASSDILQLLGTTSHYLHTVGNVQLKVYTS
ncbi:DEAD/DEAH box helicase family protein [Pedobacter sp. MR2016-19]|uniref:DEAD/DEAH box helicase n=1 Tax=Pedobacter sp. MR2016-19 TaxID=2780089 RepID=UPI001875FDC8|nr:DEAD/DEAH box helicase family protein [Pedobacter sp. MR2016-19]MBE5320944.1 DEAD/DEAH box helicase family protein [Pedobacter sp. MR2016-19]